MIWLLAALAADTSAPPSPATIVVTAPGGRQDEDDAIALSAADLSRNGRPELLGSLARDVPGLSLSYAQGNPFQPNLVYRGFVASPLQGTAQGLAVYVDGVRFNQPFGDTVDFDLLPEAAVRRIAIKDISPVYGLNALGGALVVETETGRSAPGITLSLDGGDHGRAEGSAAAGWAKGSFSAYAAIEAQHDGGWPRHSPSTLHSGFADLGWDGDSGGLHLKLLAGDSDLTGNGPAPVELLHADRRAVFTYPDNTRNRFARASLHPWLDLGAHDRLEASLYAQRLRQRTLNGDVADIYACEDDPALLCLESGDDEAPLRDSSGTPVPNQASALYGLLNRSQTGSEAAGLLVQLADTRPLLAGDNTLVVGVSYDASRTRFGSSSELGVLGPDRGVFGLGPIIAQPDGSIAPVGLLARTHYTGLFLSDTLPLGPGLDAELGLRWNEARIGLEDRVGTALDGRHVYRRLNPGIELDYEVTKGVKLRAGYAEANRAPTPAELSCADPEAPCSLTNFFLADPPLKQVVARNWEAGASGHVGGGWSIDWLLSLYRTTSSDDIQFVASETRGRAFFRNIGETRRQGVELGVQAQRGGWSVRAGYAFTDATYRTAFSLDSPDNPAAGPDGRIAVRPGDRLPGVPRHRATLAVDYKGRGFALGGDLQAQSGQVLLGDEANLQPTTHGFAVVSLHGSAKLAGPVSVFAEVSNLLDARYATFGTFTETDAVPLAEAPGASDPRSLSPGAPRRWRIGLRASF